jgi:hypothetical protein
MRSRLHEDPARDTVAPSDAILCSCPEHQTSKTDTITNSRLLPGHGVVAVLTSQMNPYRGPSVLTNLQKPPLQMISKLTDPCNVWFGGEASELLYSC